jgi:hypothetical protein
MSHACNQVRMVCLVWCSKPTMGLDSLCRNAPTAKVKWNVPRVGARAMSSASVLGGQMVTQDVQRAADSENDLQWMWRDWYRDTFDSASHGSKVSSR